MAGSISASAAKRRERRGEKVLVGWSWFLGFIAEAKKQGFNAEHIPGEELEALAKEVLSQPADVIASLKKVMGE
ncbi:MAG: hypothetical protein HYU46_16845 [Deltaproteobacteria bacterium]|nr:hypothetical protein [Deltaproteobacteria bacterium]MBI2534284.1 hypothetical protein [Deltaproteobacteria bacterium]